MEYEIYNPNEANDYNDNSIGGKFASNKELDLLKSSDVGYNKIYRQVPRSSDDKLIKKKIDFYTTGVVGSNIRDAESGEYYKFLVGSKEEDLFFKVSLATGECKSKNKSHTLFYMSPSHYSSHMYTDVTDAIISNWEEKRDRCSKVLDDEAGSKKQRRGFDALNF
jgi:hypothetical protein